MKLWRNLSTEKKKKTMKVMIQSMDYERTWNPNTVAKDLKRKKEIQIVLNEVHC